MFGAKKAESAGVTTELRADESGGLVFEVVNASAKPHRFCIYHTPFEGILTDMLEIKGGDGQAVRYQGVMVKRIPPMEKHYRTVEPGARLQATLTAADLAESYDLSRKGTFTVRFVGNKDVNGLPSSAPVTLTVK